MTGLLYYKYCSSIFWRCLVVSGWHVLSALSREHTLHLIPVLYIHPLFAECCDTCNMANVRRDKRTHMNRYSSDLHVCTQTHLPPSTVRTCRGNSWGECVCAQHIWVRQLGGGSWQTRGVSLFLVCSVTLRLLHQAHLCLMLPHKLLGNLVLACV